MKFKFKPAHYMKKLSLISAIALFGLFFVQAVQPVPQPASDLHPEGWLPNDVKAVVDQKCYGCHNANSKNEKAKEKFDWDATGELKKAKRLAVMDKIAEVLEKGEMPPKKFLEFKPEAKLSESDLATLKDWSSGKKKSK